MQHGERPRCWVELKQPSLIYNYECIPLISPPGICTDEVNDYSCSCYPGYTGRNCKVLIEDCLSSPCGNGRHLDLPKPRSNWILKLDSTRFRRIQNAVFLFFDTPFSFQERVSTWWMLSRARVQKTSLVSAVKCRSMNVEIWRAIPAFLARKLPPALPCVLHARMGCLATAAPVTVKQRFIAAFRFQSIRSDLADVLFWYEGNL